MGFSYRRPQFQSNFAGSTSYVPQSPPMFGGPSATSPAAMAYGSASGSTSPSVKAGKGVGPLPSFLNAPVEQPVSTNPDQNFQRSVNLERATRANSAIAFAQNAPLPMSPVKQPAAAPGPVTDLGPARDGTEPVMAPLESEAPAAPAPATEYNGAFGRGPQAQQQAEAARAAYIARQATVSNAQNYGTGPNMLENAALTEDYNQRLNDAADAGPDPLTAAKVSMYEANAHRSESGAKLNEQRGKNLEEMGPVQVENLKKKGSQMETMGKVAQQNADTNAANAETRKRAQQYQEIQDKVKTSEQERRSNTRLNASVRLAMIKAEIDNLKTLRKSVMDGGYDPMAINKQIEDKIKEMEKVAPTTPNAPATQPAAAGAAPGPVSSAANPDHTPENIAYTAQKHGLSVDEVKQRLGIA